MGLISKIKEAVIRVEWYDEVTPGKAVHGIKSFDSVEKFAEFLNDPDHKKLADKLGYVPKKNRKK